MFSATMIKEKIIFAFAFTQCKLTLKLNELLIEEETINFSIYRLPILLSFVILLFRHNVYSRYK